MLCTRAISSACKHVQQTLMVAAGVYALACRATRRTCLSCFGHLLPEVLHALLTVLEHRTLTVARRLTPSLQT